MPFLRDPRSRTRVRARRCGRYSASSARGDGVQLLYRHAAPVSPLNFSSAERSSRCAECTAVETGSCSAAVPFRTALDSRTRGGDLCLLSTKADIRELWIVASAMAVSNFHSRSRICVEHGHTRLELLGQGLDNPCAKARLSAFLGGRHTSSVVGHGQQPGSLV